MKIDKDTKIGEHIGNGSMGPAVKPVNYNFANKSGMHRNLPNSSLNNQPNQNVGDNLGAKTPDAQAKANPDIGEQKVQSSLANRVRNVYNKRKQQKKKDNGEPKNDTPSSVIDDGIDEIKAKLKKKVIIKLLLLISPIIFFIIIIVVAVTLVANFFPFLMPIIVESGDSTTVIENSLKENENAYYQKLLNKKSEYSNSCPNLDINLIHASLVYLYYQQEYKDIDYISMLNMTDKVFELLPSSCNGDFEVGGEFYNNLKNSQDFRNYYSIVLERKEMDDILKEIFELSKMLKIDTTPTRNFIPENTTINIDEQTGTSVGGTSVGGTSNHSSDNQITNVSFKDYLLGVVYANISEKDYNDSEKIKALVVVYTSNALARGSLSVDTQLIALNDPDNEMLYCNADKGCSFVVRENKIYLQVGGGSSGNGNNIFYNGKYYYHRELDTSTKEYLSKLVDEVYGIVLLNKDNKYDYLDVNKIMSSKVTDYMEALGKAYSDYTIKNLRENNYVEGIDFYNQRVVIPTIAYDQSDYRSVRFCGRSGDLSSNNIESSGCGVTAIAIVVSSYENSREYDPPYMSEEARKGHYCGNGIYGTLAGIFWNQADKFGYKILNVGKYKTEDLNLVLSHLSSGHMIITNVGPGTFTKGGHYIVLTGIDPIRQKVYVTDPYDRGNKNSVRKSGSGWYDFNLIAKEAYSFYIIWKE